MSELIEINLNSGITDFDTGDFDGAFEDTASVGNPYSKLTLSQGVIYISRKGGERADRKKAFDLDIVILGTGSGSQRVFYGKAFDPASASPPVCFTDVSFDKPDARKPSALSPEPKSDRCATCTVPKDGDNPVRCSSRGYLAVALLDDLKKGIVDIFQLPLSSTAYKNDKPIGQAPQSDAVKSLGKARPDVLKSLGWIDLCDLLKTVKLPGQNKSISPRAGVYNLTCGTGAQFQLTDFLLSPDNLEIWRRIQPLFNDPEVFNVQNVWSAGEYALKTFNKPDAITHDPDEGKTVGAVYDNKGDIDLSAASEELVTPPSEEVPLEVKKSASRKNVDLDLV